MSQPVLPGLCSFRNALLFAGAILLTGAAEQAPRPVPLPPAEAAKQGRALAAELLSLRPTENTTNSGMIRIRDGNRVRSQIPVRFEVRMGTDPSHWFSSYATTGATNRTLLTVTHSDATANQYRIATGGTSEALAGAQTMVPFAGSDFWVADLGLEFLHWPDQRLLRNEIRHSRSCRVLESMNPQPAPRAYSRVVSWVDNESDGIICAEAYDSNNKLLKEYITKKIKKVKGRPQLEEMEIDNRQTGSRTWVDFDLGSN